MIKKTLATLFLFTVIAPVKSNATLLTLVPYATIIAPTQLLFNQKNISKDISEGASNCHDHLLVFLFITPFCAFRDVAEIKIDAENIVFGSPISDAAKARLTNVVMEIKEKVPAAHDLSDDAVILELANSQLIKK
ncbi:MAG: hypothetical protein ACXVCR_10080 [Bdellovibrio sp.]